MLEYPMGNHWIKYQSTEEFFRVTVCQYFCLYYTYIYQLAPLRAGTQGVQGGSFEPPFTVVSIFLMLPFHIKQQGSWLL